MSQFIELLRQHKQSLIRHYKDKLDSDKYQAINAMLACKASLNRQTNWHCSYCHHHEQHPLSCGHRHCPQCQHQTTMAWLTRQRLKLLPSHYFMVTFTLPFEFRIIASAQPKALYQLMFQVAAKVIKGFSERQHQGEMGFTMVLHTHNRKRDIHPHIHILLPCGYYQKSRQQWHKGDMAYLYNELALASVWRAKILEAFNQHPTLILPKRYPRKWIANCIKVGYGEHAFEYLSRYLYRGVLPDKDIISITDKIVTFQYIDSETKQSKTRTLPILKFLWLILQHVLPKGLQRVRDYGFLQGNAKKLRLQIQLLLLNTKNWVQPASPKVSKAIRTCPCCEHEMTCLGVSRPSGPKGILR